LEMWIHGLSCFPLQEVQAAVNALMLKPPDGWTGMPKLPDVIRRIAENRETHAERLRTSNSERAPDPQCSKCEGLGWIKHGTRYDRCDCLAVRPKPNYLAQLPPAPEDRLTYADVLKTAGLKPQEQAKPKPLFSQYRPSETELEQKKREAIELAKKFS